MTTEQERAELISARARLERIKTYARGITEDQGLTRGDRITPA